MNRSLDALLEQLAVKLDENLRLCSLLVSATDPIRSAALVRRIHRLESAISAVALRIDLVRDEPPPRIVWWVRGEA